MLREKLNLTLVYAGVTHEHYSLGAPHPQFLSRLKNIEVCDCIEYTIFASDDYANT